MRRYLLLASLLPFVACAAVPAAPPSQRMVVFFQGWSAQFDDGANAVLKQAANELNATPGRPATVIGFADPTGSPQANLDISRLRAQMVYDGLVANGVAPSRIRRETHGPVNFDQTSQESRRVEIVLGG